MLVTITNISSGQVFISTHYVTLEAGGSIQVRRTLSDLDKDEQLKSLVTANSVTLAYTAETNDAVQVGYEKNMVFTNSSRPLATAVKSGTMIFNSTDEAPNFSDGTNWRDAAGNLT